MSNYNRIKNNDIFGVNYFTAGRNGYTCIDTTHGNSTGTETPMAGLTKRLAADICREINTAQNDAFEALLLVITSEDQESMNSNELYLYATTTQRIYLMHLTQIQTSFVHYMKKEKPLSELFEIIRAVKTAFDDAAKQYVNELPEITKDNQTVFTPLDIYACCFNYLDYMRLEYEANGLRG